MTSATVFSKSNLKWKRSAARAGCSVLGRIVKSGAITTALPGRFGIFVHALGSIFITCD